MWSSMVRRLAQLRAVARRSSVPRTTAYGGCDDQRIRPVVLSATQDAQRAHELALSRPELGSLERQEVALAQLTGTSLELGSSRRDQRRRSSALSAASSVARHYRPLDDEMEVAQDGL
jgi:hypothetical protein